MRGRKKATVAQHTNQDRLPLTNMSPLEKRTVELPLAAAFVDVLTEEYDQKTALEILDRVVKREAQAAAASSRRSYPELSLNTLYEVWKILGGDGRLELELEELTPRTLKFHITRCRYAENYRALGLEQLGVSFSCRRDKPFAEALIPGVRLTQSKTILEGSDRCSFEYILEEP